MVGLAQALALIPGISRSGATISGGLFLGFRREAAARFGFLLGIPAIAGAGTIELKRLLESSEDLAAIAPLLAIGVVSAFISGLLAIKLLFRILDGGSTRIFVAYRLAFAAVSRCFRPAARWLVVDLGKSVRHRALRDYCVAAGDSYSA